MFDVSKIKSNLSGLVGFKQPFNPDYAIVDTTNLASESGYFVNSNPFAKIEFLKDCQDYNCISNSEFNTVLTRIIEDSAVNVVNQVFNKPSYIDRNLIYKYALNKTETDTLPNGFVGYRIEVDNTKSIAFKITRALLDFDGTGDIDIILFNTSKKTVLQSETVSITTDHQEVELNWVLNDTEGLYKGEYFIGYIKSGSTTVTPYKRNYENAEVMSVITHLGIDKIIVPDHATTTLFDLNDIKYLNESTGLNLDISVYDDYTDLVIQNRFLFARAIYLRAVINCLQIYMASLRSNENERQAQGLYNKILLEIEGTRASDGNIAVKGLRPQLISEISTIKDEILKVSEGYLGNGYEVITEM